MKVTMLTQLCGPEGNASRGTVLDIPKEKFQTILDPKDPESGKTVQVPLADYMIQQRFARPFDPEKDRKAPKGLQKAEK